jgi:uncharacterized repeat protein (TIGR01451 family)
MTTPARTGLIAALTAFAFLLAAAPALAGTPQTLTYGEPGSHTWTVPPAVEHVEVTVVGAAGGSASSGTCTPGAGGRVVATIPVTPGEQLAIDVGGAGGNASGGTGGAAGSNGGAPGGSAGSGTPSGGGGGGGWTGISTSSEPLAVAGGGGGCGAGGGDGGSDEAAGQDGSSPGRTTPRGGGAGTAGGPGAGGISDDGFDGGDEGASFAGGAGFGAVGDAGGGGGGGGGLFGGGGGGGFQPPNGVTAGGGGGGSDFAAPVASAVTVNHGANTNDDGSAAITYTQPGTTVGETPLGGGAPLEDPGAWLQVARAGNAYTVPSDGVITSWTYSSSTFAPTTGLRLLVARGTPPPISSIEPLNAPPGSFAVIARSPAEPTPAISQPAWQVTGYPARIPVKAGDLIGAEWSAGMPTDKTTGRFADLALPGDLSADRGTLTIPYRAKMEEVVEDNGFGFAGAPDYPGLRLPISVQVEPDADGDAWGDLTQDRCPTNAGSREGCPVADLAISQTVAPTSPWPRATFTQVLTNAGPDPVADATVTEALPAGAAPVSASTSAGSCTLAATVVCRAGPLAPGASVTITLVIQAGSPGPLSLTATVASQELATAAANLPGARDQNPGNDAATAATLVEAPPAGAPAASPRIAGPTSTSVAPEITNLRQSAARWREGRKAGPPAKGKRPKVPTGTTFRFALNEQATVNMTFTRRVHRPCAAAHRARPGHKACTSTKTLGALHFDAKAGADKIPFTGRLDSGRRLPRGRIAVTFYARDAAGKDAKPRSLTFTIVK